MAVDVHIHRITFSGDDVVMPPSDGVLLIVGPNNVGKSLALREISALFTHPPAPHSPTRVVTALEVEKAGSPEDLEAWLDTHARRRDRPGQSRTYTRPGSGHMEWPTLQSSWVNGPPLAQAAVLFLSYMGPGERLNILQSSGLWDPAQEEPSAPLQFMYDTLDLEESVRQASVEAFGQPVFVNRYAGSAIHLQLGQPPERVPAPAPPEMSNALRMRPHVHEQGDGMRSFMGILLTLLTGDQRILLLDEPEAFLHPPQARLLGRKLAEAAPDGKQIIAATHSADIVIGALEAAQTAVTIVRVNREGDVNRASVLEHDQLRELWSDPVLKYSNVLDGLFHRGVVVCEGDADSLFFSAALEHFLATNHLPASELLFTFSGGKAGLHKVAAALQAVKVPVLAIADLDVLNDRVVLERLLVALGSDPEEVLDLQRMISADVESSAPNPRKEFVEERLAEILAGCATGEPLPKRAVDEMKRVLRTTGAWSPLKDAGLHALGGETLKRTRGVLELCLAAGLYILPVGELESFERAIPSHGPEWVAQALEEGVHTSPQAQEAASTIATFFGVI